MRSVIHVIDRHQLIKDPVALSSDCQATATQPKRDKDAVALARYLHDCCEPLAFTGKLSALCAQAVPDGGVAAAVNHIEVLGASLSRKIWQMSTLIKVTPQARRTG